VSWLGPNCSKLHCGKLKIHFTSSHGSKDRLYISTQMPCNATLKSSSFTIKVTGRGGQIFINQLKYSRNPFPRELIRCYAACSANRQGFKAPGGATQLSSHSEFHDPYHPNFCILRIPHSANMSIISSHRTNTEFQRQLCTEFQRLTFVHH
jgi:hypothetical protein